MNPVSLTIDQQFTLASFNLQVDNMNEQQAKETLKNLYEQLIKQRIIYDELLKHHWGLDS